MEIIKVTNKDVAVIDDIIRNHIDPSDRREQVDGGHIRTLLDDDRTYILAAMLDGSVAGYTLAYRFPSPYAAEYLAYLYDIEVMEIHRRKGIGRKLIDALRTCLKADGVKEMWLGTAVDNREGQGLFSAAGGVRSGETSNDFTFDLDDQ